MLENRTKQSRHEMDMIEKLEELRDLNQRQAHVDYEAMLQQYGRRQEEDQQRQEAEDEDYIRSELGSGWAFYRRQWSYSHLWPWSVRSAYRF